MLSVLSVCALAAIPALDVDKHTLGNGLEVIVSEDHRLPVVAVSVVYHVGAIDEPRTRTGFAHLFEHLMFQGSEHVGDDEHFRILSDAGATAINAETGFDFTHYYETVPANELALALWLESDRMGYFVLDQTKLDVQREVVKNERRQTFEDAPYGGMQEGLLRALFPSTHPYADGVIGSMAHLGAATLDDARAFFATYYTPANATLAIVGDVDKKQALALAELYFAHLRGGPKPPHVIARVPRLPVKTRVIIDEHVGKVAKLVLAWASAPFGDADDVALEVWSDLLAGGKASRLYRKLVTELHLAQDVSADVSTLAAGSLFEINVSPLPSTSVAELERATIAAVTQALATPPSAGELRRVIARDETVRLLDIESPGGDEGLANMLQLFNHYTGDPLSYRAELERYRTLTPASLMSAAKRWLTPERQTIVIAQPTDAPPRIQKGQSAERPAAAASSPTPSDRPAIPGSPMTRAIPFGAHADKAQAKRPTSGPAIVPHLPVFVRSALANGVSVYVAEDHALPIVATSILVQVGSADDPPQREGTASTLFAWLEEGAAGKDAAQLDDAFGELGTSVDVHASRDGAFLQTVVTSDRLDAATGLLADILLRPSFDATHLNALVQRLRAAREEELADPQVIGMQALQHAVFGTHPYAHATSGTPASLAALTGDDLKRFYTAHVTSAATSLVLVGDVTVAQAQALAERLFATWPRAEPAARLHVPVPPSPFKAVQWVKKSGLGQSFIALGAPTVPFGHPEAVALSIANDVFAGLFHSRLNMRLREELAMTYGVSGSHSALRDGGAFLVTVQVRADATTIAIKECLAALTALQKKPITDAEVKSAKNALLLSLPGQFTHRFDTASGFASLLSVGADRDVFPRWAERVRAITPAQVRRATATFLQPKTMQVIVVGESPTL